VVDFKISRRSSQHLSWWMTSVIEKWSLPVYSRTVLYMTRWLHVTPQHVWVVDEKRNRYMLCSSEFMYSCLLYGMIAWPCVADDCCRMTAKRQSWHSRILQHLQHSNNYTVSVGGRLQDKSTEVRHSCIALACALWRHVNMAVHIHLRDWLQISWTSTLHNILPTLMYISPHSTSGW